MKFLLLALSLFAPAAFAAEISETPGCVPAREAAEYRRAFDLKSGGFGPWDLCDETNVNKKLISAIHTLVTAEFEEGNPGPLGLKVTDESDYDYFQSRIRHLHRNGCNGGEAVIACVRNGEHTMRIQDAFFELPAVNRVATLLHEARHVDGYNHIDCVDGPLGGSSGACDLSVAYRGSYAVELAYYARVALKGKNFHPAYKALARSSAVSLMEMNFVNRPAAPRERLGLVDARDGHLILFDGQRFQERRSTIVSDAKLIARNYGIAVMPRDRAADVWLLDPYTNDALPPATLESELGSTFRSYNKLKAAERPLIVDILNRRDLQARLYPANLEIMLQPEMGDLEPALVKLDTSAAGIVGFAASSLCWRPDPIMGRPKIAPVQLLGAGGKVYQVKNMRSFEAAPSLEALDCQLPENVQSVVEFNGLFLGVLRSGEVVQISREGTDTKPYAPFAGIRVRELVNFSMYTELNDQ